eukprot:3954466-Prymnesium_polylepis.1
MRWTVHREMLVGCLSSAQAGQRPSSGYIATIRICDAFVPTTRVTSLQQQRACDDICSANGLSCISGKYGTFWWWQTVNTEHSASASFSRAGISCDSFNGDKYRFPYKWHGPERRWRT